MSDNAKSVIFLIFLLLGLPVLILLADDWLKKRRLARQERDRNALIASADFRLPYRINFTSTSEDLVQAFEAERTAVSGMRRGVRWGIIGMGWMWLLGVIVFWRQMGRERLLSAIWLVLGVTILWSNVVRPFLKRRHIRNTTAAAQELKLEFKEDGIHIEAPGVGTFDRTWKELGYARNCDEGLLVYFTDGTVDWLPRRVFPNDAVKAALHAFLLKKMLAVEPQEE